MNSSRGGGGTSSRGRGTPSRGGGSSSRGSTSSRGRGSAPRGGGTSSRGSTSSRGLGTAPRDGGTTSRGSNSSRGRGSAPRGGRTSSSGRTSSRGGGTSSRGSTSFMRSEGNEGKSGQQHNRNKNSERRGGGRRYDKSNGSMNGNRNQCENKEQRQAQQAEINMNFLERLEEVEGENFLLIIETERESILKLFSTQVVIPDMFVMIVKLIGKICDYKSQSINQLFIELSHSSFMDILRDYLLNISLQNVETKSKNELFWNDPKEFLNNLLKYFETITKLSPTTFYNNCLPLLMLMTTLIEELGDHEVEFEEIKERLEKIIQESKDFKFKETKILSVRCDPKDDRGPPPDDFRLLPIFPSRDDLMYAPQFVRANLVDGAYSSVDHYLDVQFRLMREDCFGPIRDGIKQFRRDPDSKRIENIKVHQNAVFLEPYVGQQHIGFLVKFMSFNRKENKGQRYNAEYWGHTKRFLFGSLVVFTDPEMKEILLATIIDRDVALLERGCVAVAVISVGGVEPTPEMRSPYIMIESDVFFDPYHHILKVLQDPKFGINLAMADYIVDVKVDVKTPSYLSPLTHFSIKGNEFNVLDRSTWPSNDDLDLDETQYVAFMTALTKEFSVIQGPPGTGKTYLAVKVVKAMLENLIPNQIRENSLEYVGHSESDSDSDDSLKNSYDIKIRSWNNFLRRQKVTPVVRKREAILVLCYTNHALDQFLEAILGFTDNIVRIGGQSKSEILKVYNINELRHKQFKRMGQTPEASAYFRARDSLILVMEKIHQLNVDLTSLDSEILSFREIRKHIDCEDIPHDYNYDETSYNDPMINFLFSRAAHLVDRANIPADNEYITVNDESPDIRCGVNIDENLFKRKSKEKIVSKYETCFSPTSVVKRLRQLKINKTDDNSKEIHRLEELYVRYKAFMEYKNDSQQRLQQPYEPFERYLRCIETLKKWFKPRINALNMSRESCYKRYEEVRMIVDFEVLKNASVIGITTTGAARLQKLLHAVAPSIVVVEEAAEVLESHIVVSLTNNCKHLIMIGDHKQLRPSSSYYKLAKHYNMEISLFERMIKNGILCNTLGVQHRMRPEIASLIVPAIYPVLKNHSSVEEYPRVTGVANNVFFFTHENREQSIDDGIGRKNQFEAEMSLRLANYFTQQGYEPHEVTILATYSGQMFAMKKARNNYYNSLRDVRITVVDNYQGEESKIIILSLVRNNEEGSVGFLATENRVCVALSRAREGLFMFGNMDILKQKSDLWGKINDRLVELNAIGSEMTLQCMNHPEVLTKVTEPKSFDQVPDGGCMKKCATILSCGHACPLMCHYYDRDHKEVICGQPCTKTLCELNHVCPSFCNKECPPCPVILEKVMPICGHTQKMACHIDPIVKRIYENEKRKYETKVVNKSDDELVVCRTKCAARLPCGHNCIRLCHVVDDPEHRRYKCYKACNRQLERCSMKSKDGVIPDGHHCRKKCFQDCGDCSLKINKKRNNCPHTDVVECCVDVDQEPCRNKCRRIIPECGHHCKLLCYQTCGECEARVEKVIEACGHTVKIACKKTPSRADCTFACEKNLPCGHRCQLPCKKDCTEAKCGVLVPHNVSTLCGHQFEISCHAAQTGDSVKPFFISCHCPEPCGVTLSCGHICSGSCGSCRNNRIHRTCKKECGKYLLCGHRCQAPCNADCPPCKKRCEIRCAHNKCDKLCGQACYVCKEPCTIPGCTRTCGAECNQEMPRVRCERLMSCGHRCQSLEGLTCPNLCVICRPEGLPEDLLKSKTHTQHNIFVKLEDCPHSFVIETLDKLMSADKEMVHIRKCPLCMQPIINNRLYRNMIRNTFVNEIDSIIKKINGNSEDMSSEQLRVAKKYNETAKLKNSDKLKRFPLFRTKFLRILSDVKDRIRNKNLNCKQIQGAASFMAIIAELALKLTEFEEIREIVSVAEPQAMINSITFILLALLDSNLKMPIQLQEDINLELRRLSLLMEYYIIEMTQQYREKKKNAVVASMARTALDAILVAERFDTKFKSSNDDEMANEPGTSTAGLLHTNISDAKPNDVSVIQTPELRAISALGTLQKAIGLELIVQAAEERQVVADLAVGFRQGHWFKCSNGHFFCIAHGDGTVAMEQCRECGVPVGGRNDQVVGELLDANRT